MSLRLAQQRIKQRCNNGREIQLFISNETSGFEESDSITVTIKAYPIRYAPFNRRIDENVGFEEQVDIMAYVSYAELAQVGYDINRYDGAEIEGDRYSIYQIRPYSQHDETFLYYIIGGRKN